MIIDLTVRVKKELWNKMLENRQAATFGHVGTHFDGMNKEFPLELLRTSGKIIDVRNIRERDVAIGDIGAVEVREKDFVMFHTGFLAEKQYGSVEYFSGHPQLSKTLVEYLVDRKVGLIGIDAPGIRRGAEHREIDQYCAERGVFVVENLSNLDGLLENAGTKPFTVYTFPVSMEGISGLPCRIVAEI